MLLNNATSYHINGKNVTELWFGGSKVWELIPPTTGLDGTGGFEGKTWAEVQAIVAAGEAQNNFALGDRVTIKLKNTLNMNKDGDAAGNVNTLTLEVCGFNTFSTTNTMMLNVDTTLCPQTFYMANHASDTKANWSSSGNQIRKEINSTFYNALPTELQNLIQEVTHMYIKYNSSATTNTVTEKIMIPSERYEYAPYTPKTSLTMDGFGTSTSSQHYRYIYYSNGSWTDYKFSTAAGDFVPMFVIG